MKKLFLTTSGELLNFLEAEIAAGRNPSNPKEWEEFFERLAADKKAKMVGTAPDTMSPTYLAACLRDEGFNAKVLKNRSNKQI
ncbi:MAG: hypothetical protein A2Y38_11895 [Spirochaetes bacterium GWB1_59_5]|nr:MAG: hypothetical protein A2Y38_11895 [Spirochaetes bacterium GWB1_59_5]